MIIPIFWHLKKTFLVEFQKPKIQEDGSLNSAQLFFLYFGLARITKVLAR